MSVWRERMRAHARRGLRARDRERGQGGGRLAAAHARAAVRAAVRARRGRARARALHRLLGPHPGPQPARGPGPGGGARRERVVAIDDEAVALCPFGARVPFHLQIVPRRPAARFSDDGPLGGRAAARGADAAGAVARHAAAAQHVGAHRAARRRALLLAHRGDAAAGPAGRARDRHRRAPERAGAGGRGGAAARAPAL